MADRILSFRSSEYSGYHNFPRPGTITLTGGSTTVTGSETNFRDDDAGPCMTDGTVKGGAFIWWQYTGYNDGLTHFGAPAYDNGSSSYIASCTSDTQLTLRNQYPSNSSINASMEYPRCDSAPAACVGLTWGFGSDGTATSYNGYSAAWQYGEKPANYYDNIVALYKLYYTTGLTYYRTQARLFCDDWWKNPDIDRGQQLDYDYRWGLNAMPRRSWSFTGLELCALEQSDSAMFSSFRTHSYKLWKYYIDTLFAANAPVANFQESFDLRDMAYMQKYTADCVIIETDATAKTGCVNALASADDSWIASQGLHGAFYAWWGDGGSQFTGHGANTNGTTTITLNSGDTCPSGTYWFVFWSGDPTTRPAFGTEDQTYYTGTCNGTGTITLTTAYTGSNSSNKGWIRSKSTSGGDGYPLVGWGVDNFYNGLLLLAFEQSAIAMDGIDNTSRDKYRTLANDIAAFIRDYEYDSTLTGINVFYSPLCVVGNNSLCNQRNDGDTGANLLAAEGIGGMAMNAIRTGDVTIKNLALLFEDQNFCKASTNCTGSVSSSYQVEINDGGSYVSGTPPTGTNAKYYGTFYGMPNNSAVQALVGTSLSTAISGSLPISGPTVVR
jgi:hypothetical protein